MADAAGASRGSRLAWLDALRGMAVLFVIYEHMGPYLLTGVVKATSTWVPSGRVGVYLFFLVSGYIIPASLEQRGSVRTFLVNRLFRLYPLYIVAISATLVLHSLGPMPLAQDGTGADPAATTVAHATMLPTLLNAPMILAVTWTLAFEMMFYLLVIALYAFRVLQGSAAVATALGAGALILTPLPLLAISTRVGDPRALSIGVLLVATGALAAAASRHRWAVRIGAGMLIVTAFALLVLNEQQVHVYDGLPIIATMFAGSAIYRFDHGRVSGRRLAFTLSVVAAAEIVTLHRTSPGLSFRYPIGEVVVVAVVFAVGHTWGRHAAAGGRPVPRALSQLGLISYSVYLLHDILVLSVGPYLASLLRGVPGIVQLPTAFALLAAIVAIAAISYRFIEVPGQACGRWINRALDTRSARQRPATQPALVAGAATQPAATQPAATQPAATQPAATQPAPAQPAPARTAEARTAEARPARRTVARRLDVRWVASSHDQGALGRNSAAQRS